VNFEKGSCHDFQLYKKTKLRIHPNIKQKVDSGYMGANKIHSNTSLPKKNTKKQKLTKQQKKENKELAKQRVPIEHANGKCKVFKIVENRYRSHSRFGLRVTLIAAIINANAA
jgi:DDE superfamily endonuclease